MNKSHKQLMKHPPGEGTSKCVLFVSLTALWIAKLDWAYGTNNVICRVLILETGTPQALKLEHLLCFWKTFGTFLFSVLWYNHAIPKLITRDIFCWVLFLQRIERRRLVLLLYSVLLVRRAHALGSVHSRIEKKRCMEIPPLLKYKTYQTT